MNDRHSSRRVFLRSSIAGAVSAGLGSHAFAITRRDAAPRAEVLERRIISRPESRYCGWPTLTRRRDGELVVVASAGREAHICPFGRVELMRSKDDGKTWSFPRVVMDGPIDDRDAGVLETAKGTLLVTTFTSLAYEPILESAKKLEPGQAGSWDAERLARWKGAHERVDATARKRALGVWMIRSTDGGITWSGRYDSLVNSPHGPIQLSDGRLLYAGKDLWREGSRVGVCESTDDGQTWRWLATIPSRDGDDHRQYHELHAVETKDGRIVVGDHGLAEFDSTSGLRKRITTSNFLPIHDVYGGAQISAAGVLTTISTSNIGLGGDDVIVGAPAGRPGYSTEACADSPPGARPACLRVRRASGGWTASSTRRHAGQPSRI